MHSAYASRRPYVLSKQVQCTSMITCVMYLRFEERTFVFTLSSYTHICFWTESDLMVWTGIEWQRSMWSDVAYVCVSVSLVIDGQCSVQVGVSVPLNRDAVSDSDVCKSVFGYCVPWCSSLCTGESISYYTRDATTETDVRNHVGALSTVMLFVVCWRMFPSITAGWEHNMMCNAKWLMCLCVRIVCSCVLLYKQGRVFATMNRMQ